MQTNKIVRQATFTLIATSIVGSLILPVRADETIEQTTTTGVGKYNVPVKDTVIREKDGPGDQITKKHTVYTRLSPADASQTTVESKSSNSIKYGRENYGERLRDFRSQLDKAITNKWVNDTQASDLNSEYEALKSKEAAARANGFAKADCDEFDSQLNAFNIKLSQAMSKAGK